MKIKSRQTQIEIPERDWDTIKEAFDILEDMTSQFDECDYGVFDEKQDVFLQAVYEAKDTMEDLTINFKYNLEDIGVRIIKD